MGCFVCGRGLVPVSLHAAIQCDDAVMFEAHGNYGSTVFDPMDGRKSLLINVCDACLVQRRDRVHLVTTERPLPTYTSETWQPSDETIARFVVIADDAGHDTV